MTKRDLLDKAIDACERLRGIEYRITVGKNNSETEIVLTFPVSRFHHMLGLHKLKDVNYLNSGGGRNKERIYQAVLQNDYGLRDRITNSIFVDEIIPRLRAISKLEGLLDNNEETYYSKSNYFSVFNHIDYEFAFHVIDESLHVSFYFAKEIGAGGQARYVMVSTFENEVPPGHCRRPHTLLRKAKIDKASGTTKVLFERRK